LLFSRSFHVGVRPSPFAAAAADPDVMLAAGLPACLPLARYLPSSLEPALLPPLCLMARWWVAYCAASID
jgi:hypothetical protein